MKIAFYTQNIGNYISGGRLYPWHLAHCMGAIGHQVVIFTNTMPLFDRDYANFPGKKNVKIYADNYYGFKHKERINEIKSCDLIFTSPMLSTDYGVSAAKRFGKKVIGLLYEPQNMIDEAGDNGVIIPPLSQQTLSDFAKQLHKTDAILCNNKTGVEYGRRWFPQYRGKWEHLYNGFNNTIADIVERVPIAERENAVVYISRTIEYKGYKDIPYIFSQTKKPKPKIYYVSGFIDKGNKEQNQFFETCEKLKVKMEICNRISEIEKFKILAKCKALLFPSRFEGFGIPPAESFYMGTPVVCYDLPVLKEVYKDFPHYMPFNEPQYGVDLFNDLLTNNKLLFRDIDKAREHVAGFASVQNLSKNLNDIMCRIANKKHEIQTIYVPPAKEDKSKTMKLKSNESVCIIIVGEGMASLDLRNQTHSDFNIVPCTKLSQINLDEIEENYILICNNDVKFTDRAIESYIAALKISNKNVVFSNYNCGGKKVRLPEFSPELLMARPNCLGGSLMIKKDLLKPYIGKIGDDWLLELALRNYEAAWTRVDKVLYSVEKPVKLFKPKGVIKSVLDYRIDKLEDGKSFKFNPDPSNDSKILVVVCARTVKFLPKFLESLKNQTHKNHKLVVCHHVPDGKWDSEVLELCKDYEVIKFDGEFNFSRMNNTAIAKFGTDQQHYMIVNDDVELKPDAIKMMENAFYHRWKNVGVVGIKMLFPFEDNKFEDDWTKEKTITQHAGVRLLKDLLASHELYKIKSNKVSVNYMRECETVTFGCVMFDKDCYDSLLLDEKFPNEFNDMDFCIRASQKKWKIIYNGQAVAYHHEAPTRKQFSMTKDDAAKIRFKTMYADLLSGKQNYPALQEAQSFVI